MTDDLATAPATPSEPAAKAAYEVESRIKETVQLLRAGWIRLAEDLYRFNELQMWSDLGYRSFEQWLAGPEIDLSRRQVYYLLEAWRELVVNRSLEPSALEGVEISKVQEVLPAVRRGFVDVDEALADARSLGRDDLREKYAGAASATTSPGAPAGSRPLDASTEPEMRRCEACGSIYRVKAS